jgi:hypothetical protein
MAGGIDWFRWHHGSVTDPKFQLVARKAGASLPDVLAVWAYVLEQASAAEERGHYGEIDAEAVDCMFGFPSTETRTADILKAMEARGLLAGGVVGSWEKRQPKREDDTAAERKRRQREREHELAMQSAGVTSDVSRNVTQSHADVTHGHDRGEERREEINTASTVVLAGDRPPADAPQLSLVEGGSKPKRRPLPDCPHRAVLALWAEILPALPQHDPEQWRGTRADHLRARWRETAASKGWETEDDGLRYLRKLFAYIGQSDFLTGKTHGKDRRPFYAELAWVVSPGSWAKLIEGKYHSEAA